MTREIKFRAYDNLLKHFVECGGEQVMMIRGTFAKHSEIELSQYTGLKDRNGKEIYESDIVHFNTLGGNNMYYEVRWSDAKTGFKPTRLTKTNQAELEIIGNIYENPELLSTETD